MLFKKEQVSEGQGRSYPGALSIRNIHHVRGGEPDLTPPEGRRSRCPRPNEILGQQALLGEARQPTTDHLKKTVHSGRCYDPKAELVGWPPPVEGVPGLAGVLR